MGKILGSEDNILILHNTTQTIQQVFVLDVTITCAMNFKAFSFDSQSCPFELLDVERPPVDFFTMVTSTVEFTIWPRPFSPTASEFDYQVLNVVFYIFNRTMLSNSQVFYLKDDTYFHPDSGWNTSVVGFSLTLQRFSFKYVCLYFLPTGDETE